MALPLPILQDMPEMKRVPCPGRNLCPGCPLFAENGGPCSGCTDDYRQRCLQNRCYPYCNACGGGRHAVVPASCGRSPLRDEWAKLILEDLEPHRPEPVEIRTPLIPILYGQQQSRTIPEAFPEIDAWAVPVHKILSLRGKFRTRDTKDFLGLVPGQKLILSTSGPDDYMEMLWERGEDLDYEGHGFDYWFPGHFSVYDNDSKFYQFFNARRQQIHARRVKSRFAWFRLGEHIPASWLGPIEQCPSILISCQQMYGKLNRRLLMQEMRLADGFFPVSATFFLLGSGHLSAFQEPRQVHEIHSTWIVRGLKGFDLQRKPQPHLSRSELLRKNLSDLDRAVRARRRLQQDSSSDR